MWINYTIDPDDQEFFADQSRNVDVRSYASGTNVDVSNVTIEQIAYIWEQGQEFNNTQQLFIKVKTYVYDPLSVNETLDINGTETTTGGWGENFTFTISV